MTLAHLAAIGALVREKEFSTAVDGTGHLTVDIKDFLQVKMGSEGITMMPPPEPPTAFSIIVRKKRGP